MCECLSRFPLSFFFVLSDLEEGRERRALKENHGGYLLDFNQDGTHDMSVCVCMKVKNEIEGCGRLRTRLTPRERSGGARGSESMSEEGSGGMRARPPSPR